MKKTCPNCKNEFICKQDDIINCDCYLIPIDSVIKEILENNYSDCLCKNCLQMITEKEINSEK